jgi:hypothetical protein
VRIAIPEPYGCDEESPLVTPVGFATVRDEDAAAFWAAGRSGERAVLELL